MSAAGWVVGGAGIAMAVVTAAAGGALVSPRTPPVAGADDTHRALAMARVAAYLAVGAGAAWVVRALPWGMALQGIVIIVVLALVLMVDALARDVGAESGAPAFRALQPVTRPVTAVLRPLVKVGRALERALNRLIPPPADAVAYREETAERLRELVDMRPASQVVEPTEYHTAFELAETAASEVMVPRVDILGVEVDTPWSEVLDRVRSSGHARLPVYRETLDGVLGLLYAKDLLAWALADAEPEAGWPSLMRPAAFIPGSKTIDRQLREFRKTGTHMAVVVDEFGGTAGLITIEDVLEEIVGDIRDERDVEDADVEREGNDRFWVRGRVPLTDLSDLLGESFERDDVTTVGGLVYDAFDKLPRPGDSTIIGDFRVVVEAVRRRRVERVYFERQRPTAVQGSA